MEVKQIPLKLVSPSPMNPRKTFDEEELWELALNIEKQGLLQPITVRPIADKAAFAVKLDKPNFDADYEIVCGERRYRAFVGLLSQWTVDNGYGDNPYFAIPAIVREMTDEEAFEAMITENLQRKDVDPIEEAYAFSQLIESGKTVEYVAERFGKSIRFVQDRVKLNNLIPELMLAVKENRMSISAAMIIAKLKEDDQRNYLKQYEGSYQGLNRNGAECFVNKLFMNIDRSLWYTYREPDEDFEGGCGRKCSECQLNTANHGCLFWEMKCKGAGQCTDREKFQSKSMAFMLHQIDVHCSELVKKGEPLMLGKTVICIDSAEVSKSNKPMRDSLFAELEKRGLEVVDPDKVFFGRCIYSMDDERVEKMLRDGKAYHGLTLFTWTGLVMDHHVYYVKKNDPSVNVDENGMPMEVARIIEGIKTNEQQLSSTLATTGAEVLNKTEKFSSEPLVEDEEVLLHSLMLINNFGIMRAAGLGSEYDKEKIRTYVAEHPEKWNIIRRGWICQQLMERYQCLSMAEPMLDDLGRINCPEEYEKAKNAVISKFDKRKKLAEKKLANLGYDMEGKPIVTHEEKPNAPDMMKVWREKKADHPDAILLFRMGDFYEIFGEDAVKASDILGITLTQRANGKAEKINLCAFPHNALDTNLPKLTKAGHRVAIFENPLS